SCCRSSTATCSASTLAFRCPATRRVERPASLPPLARPSACRERDGALRGARGVRSESAAVTSSPAISIIVPTFREAESLPGLIDRIARVRDAAGLDLELLIVDDDSRDGTDAVMAARTEPWLRLLVRTEDRGL